MSLATLFISGREWVLPAALLLALGLALLFWNYRQSHLSGWVRPVCFLLKFLGLAALLFCLLEPLWSGQRARPGANFFVVLADNSSGLQIKDQNEPKSRGDWLRDLLTREEAPWQAPLEETFQVRRYLFDSRLQSVPNFSELSFDGRASSLGYSLRTLGERYRGQPLAGILLFTDGNATDLAGELAAFEGLAPVYPVVAGKDDPIKDVAIEKVAVTQTAFEDAPVSIQANLRANGYAGRRITGQLLELTGAGSPEGKREEKLAAEQTLRAPDRDEPFSFRFQIRPESKGISFYRFRAAAQEELSPLAPGRPVEEATLANNSRIVVVDRGGGPYRVLYVSGRPNWEYKFLNRALSEDDQVQLVGLIRIARREPKFEFKGRFGESSNPLFRGFDRKTEETERYDQPVLVRLNTRDELELRGGFPKTAEELYGYDAIMLDDLEADFFKHDQKVLLEKFVSERGGGMLMLGGLESFQKGNYNRTPIGDMLPVYLDGPPPGSLPEELRLNLTREGWLQPWMRLRSTEAEERTRLSEMPAFGVLNRVRGVKPGAMVIATVADSQGSIHPALVVQRFGYGRTGALLIGDFWRWQLRQGSDDMAKAWRQMIRWLVADVPEQIEIVSEPDRHDPNQAVRLQVRVRDAKFESVDDAAVTITVEPVAVDHSGQPGLGASDRSGAPAEAGALAVRLRAEPSLSEPGLYEATYVPRRNGGYHARAAVTNAAGAELGRAEAGWVSDITAEEFASLKPNRALLESLARQTGGEMIAAEELPEFVGSLPSRKAPITEAWTFPFWHQPVMFLFALVCFVAEWGLRRWKGLP